MNCQPSRWGFWCLLPACVVLLASAARGQLLESPAARSARQDAVDAIPFAELTPEMQQQIRAVVNKPTVYRRLPRETIDCDPHLYLFLLRNPDVVVRIWDLMGATQIDLQRTGPYSFRAKDSAGTASDIQLAYGTKDIHIYYAEGTYEGALLNHSVAGRCVLVLRTGYERRPDGGARITSVLDMFLDIDNLGVDVLAKTFQPFLGRYADYNFVETARFVGRLSDTAEKNGAGMQRLAQRLTELDPAVRDQFAAISAHVERQAALRTAAHTHSAPATPVPVPASRGDVRSATLRQPMPVPARQTQRMSFTPEIISRYPVDYPIVR